MSDDVKLDGSLGEFHISEVGKNSGETFTGDFTVRCFLNPLEVLKADRLYRELMGAINPHLASSEAQNFSFALSQLKFRIVKSPSGWKNSEIDGGHLDDNVVIAVLNKAIAAQILYKERSVERMKGLQNKLTEQIKDETIKPEEEIAGEDNGQ